MKAKGPRPPIFIKEPVRLTDVKIKEGLVYVKIHIGDNYKWICYNKASESSDEVFPKI